MVLNLIDKIKEFVLFALFCVIVALICNVSKPCVDAIHIVPQKRAVEHTLQFTNDTTWGGRGW